MSHRNSIHLLTKGTLGISCFSGAGEGTQPPTASFLLAGQARSHLLAKKCILCIFLHARSPLRLQVPSYQKSKRGTKWYLLLFWCGRGVTGAFHIERYMDIFGKTGWIMTEGSIPFPHPVPYHSCKQIRYGRRFSV